MKDFKPNKIDTSDMRGSSVITSLANATIGMYQTPVPNQVLMKVIEIRNAPKPEECYLMERICDPGHHHFQFLQMVKEEDAFEPKSEVANPEPQQTRSYRRMPDAEREEVHDFWRTKREEGLSFEDIKDLSINVLHVEVSTQTIWNFFPKE